MALKKDSDNTYLVVDYFNLDNNKVYWKKYKNEDQYNYHDAEWNVVKTGSTTCSTLNTEMAEDAANYHSVEREWKDACEYALLNESTFSGWSKTN